jgi:hypothetical protein
MPDSYIIMVYQILGYIDIDAGHHLCARRKKSLHSWLSRMRVDYWTLQDTKYTIQSRSFRSENYIGKLFSTANKNKKINFQKKKWLFEFQNYSAKNNSKIFQETFQNPPRKVSKSSKKI